jgi:3-oxoacyl-[acyl-carrier protein] reductase
MSKSVAIVTGASSGIGRATAIRLALDFSAVVLAARGAVELGEVAEQVRAQGAEPLAIDLDLTVPAAADSLIGRTWAKFGRIDALLNIAGAVPGIGLFQMTDEQWKAGIELKLHGARRITLRAWEALKAAKGSVRRLSMIEKWAAANKVGIGRYGEPQDIAELMAFLVSPAARWMTGTQLRIDGGEVRSI